jgi:hypothetical protein
LISSDTDRAEFLRQLIAVYRGYMRQGVTSDEAAMYLRQIKEDEAELETIAAGAGTPNAAIKPGETP